MSTFTSVPYRLKQQQHAPSGAGLIMSGGAFGSRSRRRSKAALDWLKKTRKKSTKISGKAGEALKKKTSGLKAKLGDANWRKEAGKRLLKQVAKEGLETAMGVGADYAIDRALYGDYNDGLDTSDVKDIVKNAGMATASQAALGQKTTVKKNLRAATNAKLGTKARGRPSATRNSIADRLRALQAYMEKRRREKKARTSRGYDRRLTLYRPFGTGAKKGKKNRKNKKKKKGKKGKKGKKVKEEKRKR